MLEIWPFWTLFLGKTQTGRHERHGHPGRLPRVVALLILLAGQMVVACAPVHREGVRSQPQLNRIAGSDEITPATSNIFVARNEYLINPGDKIDVKFIQRPAYSDTYVVRQDGRISLPWLNSVVIAGHTVDDFQGFLATKYAKLRFEMPPPSQRRYLLSVDDVLDVRFPFSEEFNSQVVVRPDGRISLPLVKSVIVEGKTPEQVEAELIARYRRHMKDPDLVVMVREHSSNTFEYQGQIRPIPMAGLSEVAVKIRETLPLRIFVGGEVPVPGTQPFRGHMTAIQAIMTAGGSLQTGDMRSVVILRKGAGNKALFIVRNLEKDLQGEGTSDIALQPFDVVVVPRSTIAKVGDALDQYLYRLVKPLANSSIGFFFTKQIGTSSVNQTNKIR